MSLQAITIPAFIEMSREAQRNFLKPIKISELKSNRLLLQKFVALKVLMEARAAVEDQSLFNLTAQFRNFIASFGLKDWKFQVEGSSPDELTTNNSYRLFHISDIGRSYWTRKTFHIGIDDNNELFTQQMEVKAKLDKDSEEHSKELHIWKILNRADLKAVFAEIKKETRYENPFGYDLFCVAIYYANKLLLLNYKTIIDRGWGAGLLLLPFVLALNLAIYAIALPLALTTIALEYCIIEPIKWVVKAVTPDYYEEFIENITSGLEGEKNDEDSTAEAFYPT